MAAALGVFSLAAGAQQKVFVYTSMKESMVGDLKAAFAKKHPDIKLDYQSAGAGKLMAKIAAERQSGKILADVLWTSEVPDFYQLKAQSMLLPYMPADVKILLNPLPDYDGSFTAVRFGTLYFMASRADPAACAAAYKKRMAAAASLGASASAVTATPPAVEWRQDKLLEAMHALPKLHDALMGDDSDTKFVFSPKCITFEAGNDVRGTIARVRAGEEGVRFGSGVADAAAPS
ncbi:MAG: extracellular solute-binding protein [Deltaproteobacteria bacterium]